MRVRDVFIRGVGEFLPEPFEVEQAVADGLYPAEDVAAHGWERIRIAGDLPAPDMALAAARQALEHSGDRPEDVGLLFYAAAWHQGPDAWQPQYHLQRELLGGNNFATRVDQGCNGMFGALELAAGQLTAFPQRRLALLAAADNFGTELIDRWRSGPGFIMGDAGCALVLGREAGFAEVLSVHSRALPELDAIHRGDEPLFPPGATVGGKVDFGARLMQFAVRLQTEGIDLGIFGQIPTTMVEVVEQTLDEAGISRADIKRVCCMNDSREVVEQRIMAPIGLPFELSTWDYGRTVGHVGAGDQFLAFAHLVRTGQLAPGDHVLLVGVGPGITISAAVVRIDELPPSAAQTAQTTETTEAAAPHGEGDH